MKTFKEFITESSSTTFEARIHKREEEFPLGYNLVKKSDDLSEIKKFLSDGKHFCSELISFTRSGGHQSSNSNMSHMALNPNLVNSKGFYVEDKYTRNKILAGPYKTKQLAKQAIDKRNDSSLAIVEVK